MTDPASAPGQNRRWFVVAFVAVTLAVAGISVWTNLSRMGQGGSAEARAPGDQTRLEILTMTGKYPFTVEVMRTDAERAKGLMFRTSMPGEHGMLFDFERDQHVSMWMKNTYISLDMVFLKADGTVHRIERRTEPHSERTISSGEPVRAVLEVNGGIADKLSLKPGDRIFHPMFPAK
jgi:uncharacterized membrane protein (UPF0127 family)